MYKNQAKFFTRSKQLAGLEEIYPGLANAQALRLKRHEQRLADQKTAEESRRCRECEKEISRAKMTEHLYESHQLCRCRYCKQFVQKGSFTAHIKEIHGLKVFKSWVKLKQKRNDRKD